MKGMKGMMNQRNGIERNGTKGYEWKESWIRSAGFTPFFSASKKPNEMTVCISFSFFLFFACFFIDFFFFFLPSPRRVLKPKNLFFCPIPPNLLRSAKRGVQYVISSGLRDGSACGSNQLFLSYII